MTLEAKATIQFDDYGNIITIYIPVAEKPNGEISQTKELTKCKILADYAGESLVGIELVTYILGKTIKNA
jgi:hypothetical protein